jgi:hypothetical protein
MRLRSPCGMSAPLVALILPPAAVPTQVDPFRECPGLLPQDNQLAQAVEFADGTWTVQGTRIPGSRRCGDWLVHLTSSHGQLFGEVSQGLATVPIQNLVLLPDGSFSGATPERLVGRRRAPASKVIGKFSGDMISLTFESEGEKPYCLTGECSRDVSRCLTKRAPQPLGFVAALRMLLDSWMRNESAEGSS